MTTSEHMTQLAREHPDGFVVIPAMFERWAAQFKAMEGARDLAIDVLGREKLNRENITEESGERFNILLHLIAALDAKEGEPDASTPQ